ncbi:alpha/beta fold hydrolase [Paraburkholderia elongata]|uniref:Alpha/beta fold hydrolase n=1 Tax=Paraburkholderia elongata TaxID=2675747 RepID=A0A972SHM8_9BURK|nr:alpha/beta hydrolase [Paraburkholderia elongata]NPT53665.1 alpha/beta fold hydrolase [Paraburkholderia elongata]
MTETSNAVTRRKEARLLFLHGFACAKEDWRFVASFLPAHTEFSTYDFPGHGTAPAPQAPRDASTSNWSIEYFAAEVVRHLQRFEAAPVILAGHSLGCRVALEVAARAPERVNGLVLIEASMIGERSADAACQHIYSLVEKSGFNQFVENRFNEMFLSESPLSKAILARAKNIDPVGGTALFASMAGWDAGLMATRLGRFTKPMLIIQSMYFDALGKRRPIDETSESSWLRFVSSVAPAARIELVKESGHFPHIEQPEKIAYLLRDFVSEISTLRS